MYFLLHIKTTIIFPNNLSPLMGRTRHRGISTLLGGQTLVQLPSRQFGNMDQELKRPSDLVISLVVFKLRK